MVSTTPHPAGRDERPRAASSLGAALEHQRLTHRASRIEEILVALQLTALRARLEVLTRPV